MPRSRHFLFVCVLKPSIRVAVGSCLAAPPPGFGHDYATEYLNGWVLVAPPAGWTQADTDRLETFLDHGVTGESEPY